MFNLSKNWTGVERKKDGTLLYQGKGFLSLLGQRKDVYVIEESTNNYLRLFVLIQIILTVPILVYFKKNMYNFQSTTVLVIFFVLLIIGEILWKLTDNFVKKRALKIYE